MTSSLARGLNFPNGAYALVAWTGDDEQLHVYVDGDSGHLTDGILVVLQNILSTIDNSESAAKVRDKVAGVLIADEQQRFQQTEDGGDAV